MILLCLLIYCVVSVCCSVSVFITACLSHQNLQKIKSNHRKVIRIKIRKNEESWMNEKVSVSFTFNPPSPPPPGFFFFLRLKQLLTWSTASL
ncbi:hypothetical protein BY996DRAFT_6827844 [Phakopsora pachyrhizi]|nr:hypothetical protein BY996DRAFT_6827844 [Phakopsora pachyrhizi]